MAARPEEAVIRQRLDSTQFNAEMDRQRARMLDSTSAITSGTGALATFQGRVEKTATAVSGMGSVLGGMGSKAGASFGAVSNLAAAFLAGGPLLVGIAAATTATAVAVSTWQDYEKSVRESEEALASMASTLSLKLNAELRAQAEAIRAVDKEIDNLVLGTDQARLAEAEFAEFEATNRSARISGAVAEREALVSNRRKTIKEQRKLEADAVTSGAAARARSIRVSEEAKLQDDLLVLTSQRIRRDAAQQRLANAQRSSAQLSLLNDEKDRQETAEKQKRAREKREKEEAKAQRDFARDIAKAEEDELLAKGALVAANAKRSADAAAHGAAVQKEAGRAVAKEFRELDRERKAAAKDEATRAKGRAEAQKIAIDRTIGELKRLEREQKVTGDDRHAAQISTLEADLAGFTDSEKAKTLLLEREVDARIAIERAQLEQSAKFRQLAVQGAEAVASSAIQSASDLVISLADGEERAFERAAAAFLRSTGTQLVALGTQAVFEGGRMVINKDPAGVAMIALGVGAIGAGTAMGAVSAGISRNVSSGGSSASFGSGAQSPRDRSTVPGRSSSRPAVGEVVATTVIQFLGSPVTLSPTADGARNLRQISQRGNRRHLLQAEID